jgi:lipopolysaccharide transport system permease protein
MQRQQCKLAIQDITTGIKSWRGWFLLAWQDIRLRYRRSLLGPFWITLNMAIMIYTMGFLYGYLFRINLAEYFPYLASGLIVWTFISTLVTDSSVVFVSSAGFIRQIKLPYITYLMRMILRNFIIFLHNMVAIIPIIIYFHIPIGWHDIYILWGLLMIMLCGLIYGMMIAMLSTRFRDVQPIVISAMQVLFLLTPIVWSEKLLPNRLVVASTLNPFQQLINLVREPLMGVAPSHYSIFFVLILIIIGLIMLLLLMVKLRRRIVFWL